MFAVSSWVITSVVDERSHQSAQARVVGYGLSFRVRGFHTFSPRWLGRHLGCPASRSISDRYPPPRGGKSGGATDKFRASFKSNPVSALAGPEIWRGHPFCVDSENKLADRPLLHTVGFWRPTSPRGRVAVAMPGHNSTARRLATDPWIATTRRRVSR
jgi:hypothetical protein